MRAAPKLWEVRYNGRSFKRDEPSSANHQTEAGAIHWCKDEQLLGYMELHKADCMDTGGCKNI